MDGRLVTMSETRYIWLVDKQPTHTRYTGLGNVTGSIKIRVKFKPTFPTKKRGTTTITFVNVPANRTLLRGVPCVNKDNLFAEGLGFVPDKPFEFKERPAIKFPVEFGTMPFLNAYFRQVFECKDCGTGLNNSLRDTVIDISHEPSFSTRYFTEFPFSRSSAFRLQLSSEIRVLCSRILHSPRIKEGIVGTDCDVNDTTIYSENFGIINRVRGFGFELTIEVERVGVLSERKVRRFYFPPQISSVIIWDMKKDFNTPIGCSKSSVTRIQIHPDNSGVVSHSRKFFTEWFKLTLNRFQRFTSTISRPLHKRRWEIRDSPTNITIGSMMATHLIKGTGVEAPFGASIERHRVIFHSCHKRFHPIGRDVKFQLGCPNHSHILILLEEILNGEL
jgi:hypothetical protein